MTTTNSKENLITLATALGIALALVSGEARAQSGQMRFTMYDGSVLIGAVVAQDGSTVTLQSSIGAVRVPRASIASIDLLAPPAASQPRPYRSAPQAPSAYASAAPSPYAPEPPTYAPEPRPYVPPLSALPPAAPSAWAYTAQPAPQTRHAGRALIVWGSVAFGVSWSLAIVGAVAASRYDGGAYWLYFPVVGPIAWLSTGSGGGGGGNTLVLIADALLQAGGLTMLIAGIVRARSADRAEADAPRLAIAPTFGPQGAGFAVAGRF